MDEAVRARESHVPSYGPHAKQSQSLKTKGWNASSRSLAPDLIRWLVAMTRVRRHRRAASGGPPGRAKCAQVPSIQRENDPVFRRAMTLRSNFDTLVTVFGGSGFLGRHVVRALANRDYRIRVAVRRPELCRAICSPLGRVGQSIGSGQPALSRLRSSPRFAIPRGDQPRRDLPKAAPSPSTPSGRRRRRSRQGGCRRRGLDGPCLRDRRRRAVRLALFPRQGRR